jgi:hypothetical protein
MPLIYVVVGCHLRSADALRARTTAVLLPSMWCKVCRKNTPPNAKDEGLIVSRRRELVLPEYIARSSTFVRSTLERRRWNLIPYAAEDFTRPRGNMVAKLHPCAPISTRNLTPSWLPIQFPVLEAIDSVSRSGRSGGDRWLARGVGGTGAEARPPRCGSERWRPRWHINKRGGVLAAWRYSRSRTVRRRHCRRATKAMVQEHDLAAMHAKKKTNRGASVELRRRTCSASAIVRCPKLLHGQSSSMFHDRPPVTCCSCSAQGDKLFGGFFLDLIRSEMKLQN